MSAQRRLRVAPADQHRDLEEQLIEVQAALIGALDAAKNATLIVSGYGALPALAPVAPEAA